MRRLPVALVLALLLLPSLGTTHAQGPDPADWETDEDAALAPVETAIGTIPRVVALAIEEADRDGTPDRAQRLADQLENYTDPLEGADGFAASTRHPDAAQAFRLAREVAILIQQVPSEMGVVSRISVGCDTWAENSTAGERVDWAQRTWPGFNRLSTVSAAIEETRTQLPSRVDGAPLAQAVERLDAWRIGKLEPSTSCLPPPDFFFLQAHPQQAWPGARVLVQGGLGDPPPNATVHLWAPALDLDRNVTLGDEGGFLERVHVPADVPIGNVTITARTDDGSGNRTTNATLAIVQAPARLRLSHPATGTVGRTVEMTVRVTTPAPLPLGSGPVTLTGDVERTVELSNGTGRVEIGLPTTPGLVSGTARYPGTDRIGSASASYTLEAAAVQTAQIEQTDPEPFYPSIPERPSWTTLAWIAAPLVLLAGAWYAIKRMARTPRGAVDQATGGTMGAGVADEPLEPVRKGLIRAFVHLVLWLRRREIVSADMTPREIGEKLAHIGVPSADVVAAFERARYGGHQTQGSSTLVGRLWDRLTGVFR